MKIKGKKDIVLKKFAYILTIVLTAFLIRGCSKDENDDEKNNIVHIDIIDKPSPSPTVKPTPTPEIESYEGKMRSYLTGQWVDEEIGQKRPYAVQFSNFKTVANQWGIGQADIVYEALVEGGITRLLAIGENFTGDRIGSIRSSRHYFASLAEEYNAIYIHFGKTKYAVSKLKELKSENLDGETGIGTTVFYRDKSMNAPHNAFASLEGIHKGIEKKAYDTEYSEDFEPHFQFHEKEKDLPGDQLANKVTVGYSYYTSPCFEYNEEDKLYYRYQFGGPHKDSNTDQQLTFKNLIIQFVKQRAIDRNDYQTIDFEDASGLGIYITNGKRIPITWKKNEKTSFMRYYTEDGQELIMNPGKTFITLFPDRKADELIIED